MYFDALYQLSSSEASFFLSHFHYIQGHSFFRLNFTNFSFSPTVSKASYFFVSISLTSHFHYLILSKGFSYLRSEFFFVSSTRGPNVIGLHVNAFTFFSQPTSQKQLETVIYVEMYILRGFFALLSGCQEDKFEQLYLIIITLGPPVVLLSFYKK